ncbi:phage minor capsid protein [Ruminococcus sp.]
MRQQYEPSADRIIALYQQLEDDILSAVIRRILKMGYVSEASKHQLEVLQAAGLLYDDIVQLIADRTDACTAQVKALFEDAGVQTVAIDNSLHEAAGALPIDIRQDSSPRQVLEAGYKKTLGTMQNLVSTTATQTQTAFIQTCDRIYMQVSSGAFSYQEAIMNALRALADTGATVSYPTGHTNRMDVAVRLCVLTGVSQTAAAVSLQQAEDAGCYLMEITAHSGARHDHAKWQGQLVTITGKDAGKIIDGLRVFTLSEIGYGSGEGFKGWNCRHNWHAYYPGFSTPNYTPEELKKLDEPCISYNGKLYTEYEVSQMQRAQERRVRAWKRRCITAQESVNSATDEATRATAQAEFDRSARYLKNNEAKLKDFCRQTGQDRDRFREQVLGFNRSTAQKSHACCKEKWVDF